VRPSVIGTLTIKELNAMGQAGAAALLAEVYLEGMGGLSKQPRQALFWAREAIKGGHPHGHFVLGQLYELGEAVPKNEELATDEWAIAAAYGDTTSQYSLAIALAKGLIRKFGVDPLQAYKLALLAKASSQGLLLGTPGVEGPFDLHLETKAKAGELADLIGPMLSQEQRALAEHEAASWRPKKVQVKPAKFTLSDHEAIREVVLGDEAAKK
jgi:hypothetical protein